MAERHLIKHQMVFNFILVQFCIFYKHCDICIMHICIYNFDTDCNIKSPCAAIFN